MAALVASHARVSAAENFAAVRRVLPVGLEVIEFVNELDAASRAFLREVFQRSAQPQHGYVSSERLRCAVLAIRPGSLPEEPSEETPATYLAPCDPSELHAGANSDWNGDKLMLLDRTLSTRELDGAAIEDLEAHLLGVLIRPGQDDYESARQVQNLAIDRRPGLIARVADAADVIRCVNFARENHLALAVRSGGHSMSGLGVVDGGLVIDMRRMNAMSIQAERRTAWVQPGLTWGPYAQRANEYGLATSSGDTASVGVGGLTLGGGIGWMVRKYGLAIDNLLSAELVTADGRLLRASAEENSDLFWAVRGGGANFGVATAFQFRLSPAGTILGGAVIYPASAEVLRGWADYASQAPDELTTIVTIMPAPPLPFIPEDQHGKLVAIVGLAYVGDIETGQRVVDPLRGLGTPIADITAPMPYPAIFALSEEATQPAYMTVRSGYMSALDGEILGSIVEHSQRTAQPAGIVQLRALGGAMARVPTEATAFGHRDARFMATVIGATHESTEAASMRTWAEELWNVVKPQASGVYVNFLEDEGPERVREAYTPATYERLLEIKRRYDPTNFFRLNQNISPV